MNYNPNGTGYIIGQLNSDGSVSKIVIDKNKLIFQYFSDMSTFVGQTVIAEIIQ